MRTIYNGDCLEVLPTLPQYSFDCCVTDSPYGISFDSAEAWDHTVPGPAYWRAVLPALKPSAYLLAFGSTRTWHRLACAIEDAGFEIRDTLCWLYGNGFPKGRACLKPGWEPIIVARKPGKLVPLGIEECRIGEAGRYPANVAHDGSAEVEAAFAEFGQRGGSIGKRWAGGKVYHGRRDRSLDASTGQAIGYGDKGTASRFYFSGKATKAEREGNPHPTIKPVKLMEWLVNLVCPVGGRVLDPFAGSASTGLACKDREFVGIELDPLFAQVAAGRLGIGVAAAI